MTAGPIFDAAARQRLVLRIAADIDGPTTFDEMQARVLEELTAEIDPAVREAWKVRDRVAAAARVCVDCESDISRRGPRATRCALCAADWRRETDRERWHRRKPK